MVHTLSAGVFYAFALLGFVLAFIVALRDFFETYPPSP
jgi:hypothetical protein